MSQMFVSSHSRVHMHHTACSRPYSMLQVLRGITTCCKHTVKVAQQPPKPCSRPPPHLVHVLATHVERDAVPVCRVEGLLTAQGAHVPAHPVCVGGGMEKRGRKGTAQDRTCYAAPVCAESWSLVWARWAQGSVAGGASTPVCQRFKPQLVSAACCCCCCCSGWRTSVRLSC